MTRQEACQFCGSGWTIHPANQMDGVDYYVEAEIWCPNPDCEGTPNPVKAPTTEGAIALWNARALTTEEG